MGAIQVHGKEEKMTGKKRERANLNEGERGRRRESRERERK